MKATRKQLEEFIAAVAEDNTHHKVMAAKAKKLLDLPLKPFEPAMVLDCIRDARFADSEADMQSELIFDLKALGLLYGDAPIEYIVDRIEREDLPKEWDDVVLSELGRMGNETTANRRRLILERILMETKSPLTEYTTLCGIVAIDNPQSIEVVKAYAAKDHIKMLDQVVDMAFRHFNISKE